MIDDGFDRSLHCHKLRIQLKQLNFRFLYRNITRCILFDDVFVECFRLTFLPEIGVLLAALLSLLSWKYAAASSSHSFSFSAFYTFSFRWWHWVAAVLAIHRSFVFTLSLFFICFYKEVRVQGHLQVLTLCGFNSPSKSICWKLFWTTLTSY